MSHQRRLALAIIATSAFVLCAVAAARGHLQPEISSHEALARVAALPEVKVWTDHVTQATAGQKKGTLVLVAPDDRPVTIQGQRYWRVDFIEEFVAPTASPLTHRWETFVVALDDGRILVFDLVKETLLTLEAWRRETRPIERATGLDDPATRPTRMQGGR